MWIVSDKSESPFYLNLRSPPFKQCIWEVPQMDPKIFSLLASCQCSGPAGDHEQLKLCVVESYRPLRWGLLASFVCSQSGNLLPQCPSWLPHLLHTCQTSARKQARANFKRHVCPSAARIETTDCLDWINNRQRQFNPSNEIFLSVVILEFQRHTWTLPSKVLRMLVCLVKYEKYLWTKGAQKLSRTVR